MGNKRIAGEHGAGDDEESTPALGGRANGIGISNGNGRGSAPRSKWGARGISVSADDGVLDQQSFEDHGVTDALDPDAKMHDPDDLARALDDEDEGSPSRAGGSAPLLGESSDDNKNNNHDRRDHHNAWADD